MSYYRSTTSGGSFSSTGIDLFTGLEGLSGRTLPYAELRWLIGEGRSVQISGGISVR